MPIKWTPELDSILLHAVFEECNISFSKALCTKITTRIEAAGIDCTPKAVENRLYSWKKKNVGSTTAASGSTPSKPTRVAKDKTPKTPRTPNSSGKKNNVVTPDHEREDDDEEMWADSPRERKRGFAHDDGDEEKVEKKVKLEYGEDEWA
ncbi:hypothetical protein BDU57DRAFT_596018 [Ampelomyces quisqualis]|uniref:Uncharacterized protein n=1 Tax=Ampelomyces quisqualis TaxID=50730 RepID=A0A6A5QL09_AMPQU|nr:hypothetical protein BDU57DRAFT_596018 [Ampelomyces quisqualis]